MRAVVPEQLWARKGALITAAAIVVTGVGLLAVGYPALASKPAHRADAAAPQPSPTVAGALPHLTTQLHAAALPGSLQEWIPARPTHVAKPAPHDARAISALAANGIPATALNAYRVPAARLGHVSAGCGLDWALLAGIGREESDHGRFAGAVLHTDGTSTSKIIGPALDGHGTQYIPAPADGLALDGDAKYTHALGPMQFIPQTWATYGADATGDGVADVFNINDAALGAARYLCSAGGDLRTRAGQERAVLAYNHSDAYVAQVLALADAYRRGVPISGLPVGNTTGALGGVPTSGTPLPANPGRPIGVTDGKAAKKATNKPTPSAAKGASSSPVKPPASGSPTASSGSASTGSGSSSSSAPAPKPGQSSSAPAGGTTTSSAPAPSGSPSSSKPCLPIFGQCLPLG